jgi:hypothetical protein
VIGLVWAATALASADGAEISQSRGRKTGIVVLAPRVVPATEDAEVQALAARVQQRVAEAAIVRWGAAQVDVRPSPERVCPKVGCRGASIGVLLGHQDGGCVAIAILGPPGPVEQRLLPVAGRVEMLDDGLAFRATPESKVIVREFVSCAALEQALTPERLAGIVPPPPAEAL